MSKKITIIKNEQKYDKYFYLLEKICKKNGFQVNTARLEWKNNSLLQSLTKLESQPYSETVIAFSVNAFLSLYIKNSNIKNLILIAPSPFFSESIFFTPAHVKKKLGKRRLNDINNFFSIKKIIKKNLFVIVGTQEPKLVQKYAKIISTNSFHTVKGASHNLNEYLENISLYLKKKI